MSAKDSTAVDTPFEHADEEAAKNFKLDPHLISLMWNEPFFSKILRKITKVPVNGIPTAGIGYIENSLTMFWNPRFFAALNSKEVCEVIKHECYHAIFEHITTRKHEPHIIWNYATDLAINSLLDEHSLPAFALIPGRAFPKPTPEQIEKLSPEALERHQKISDKIQSLPKGENAEWYFSQLMDDEEIKKAIQEEQKSGSGIKLKIDEDGNLTDQDGNPVTVTSGTLDDHGSWEIDDMDEADREFVKGKLRQALEDAVHECDQSGKWGSVSASTRSKLRSLVNREIPWQSVLRQFCGLSRRANRHNNVKRLNRKYPGIHPGIQKGYTSNLAIYIDQSGSVDNHSLELLFGTLRDLSSLVSFTVFHFDTEVDKDSETTWSRGKTPDVHRTRSGGTDFSAPTKHANENKNRFDGYLILTDGEAPDPGPSRLKRGWVVIPGRTLQFAASKRDFVIKMKNHGKTN